MEWTRPRLRGWVVAALCAPMTLLTGGTLLTAGAAMALEVGEVKSGYAELNGRQVPLPVGDWVVAGKGRNQVVSGISGAYGSIDNVVLMQVQGQAVRGVVEINTNAISVTAGWGTTDACARPDALARHNLYRTAVDGMCFFVAETIVPSGDAAGPEAWKAAIAYAAERKLAVPDAWMTVGYRVSNRQDLVDTRYHFDGQELGAMGPGRTEWSAQAAHLDTHKLAVVTDLNAWAGLMSELFEIGLRGRLPDRLHGKSIPQPLAVVDVAKLDPDKIGRASKDARRRALGQLVEEGVISSADLEAYHKAVAEVAPPPTIEDYYKMLLTKTISFNMFRVSVDYLLAFIVTVNTAVSGYITATIVATHSVAQVLNDMAWDRYISGQKRDGSERVEFQYIGRSGGAAL